MTGQLLTAIGGLEGAIDYSSNTAGQWEAAYWPVPDCCNCSHACYVALGHIQCKHMTNFIATPRKDCKYYRRYYGPC